MVRAESRKGNTADAPPRGIWSLVLERGGNRGRFRLELGFRFMPVTGMVAGNPSRMAVFREKIRPYRNVFRSHYRDVRRVDLRSGSGDGVRLRRSGRFGAIFGP